MVYSGVEFGRRTTVSGQEGIDCMEKAFTAQPEWQRTYGGHLATHALALPDSFVGVAYESQPNACPNGFIYVVAEAAASTVETNEIVNFEGAGRVYWVRDYKDALMVST